MIKSKKNKIFDHFTSLSVERKLNSLFLIIAIIPIFILAFLTYHNAQKMIVKKQVEYLSTVNELQKRSIISFFTNRLNEAIIFQNNHFLKFFLETYRLQKNNKIKLKKLNKKLTEVLFFFSDFNEYNNIIIVNKNNRVLFSLNPLYRHLTGLELNSFQSNIISNASSLIEGISVTKVFFKALAQQNVISITVDILINGKKEGVIILEILTKSFLSLLNEKKYLGETGQTLLAIQQGQDIVFLSEAHVVPIQKSLYSNTSFVKFALRKQKGTGRFMDLDGIEAVAAWDFLPFLNWAIVSKVDLNSFMKPIHFFGMGLLGTILLLTILILYFSNKFARYLTKPMDLLCEHSIANLSRPCPEDILKDKNQMRKLTRLFILMLSDLDIETKKLKLSNKKRGTVLKEIQGMQDQLIESSKLSALGEMAGGISHEINNPMTVIAGNIKLLKKKAITNKYNQERFVRSFEIVEKEIKRIIEIIQSVKGLIYTKNMNDSDSDIYDMTNIETVLNDVNILCQHRYRNHNINLIIDRSKEQINQNVQISSVYLSQIFVNIINNACDALEDQAEGERWIRLSILKDHEYLFIRFFNSGKLINENIRNKIFQAFYTTKDTGKGTGIGLSLSRNMLLKVGGDLFLDTNEENTCFVVKVKFKLKK